MRIGVTPSSRTLTASTFGFARPSRGLREKPTPSRNGLS
jgi:hypothetical protein